MLHAACRSACAASGLSKGVTVHTLRHSFATHDAIERLVFDFLGMTHDGCEDSDGAYGDFTFDVAEPTITLDYNERYTQSEHSQHVF